MIGSFHNLTPDEQRQIVEDIERLIAGGVPRNAALSRYETVRPVATLNNWLKKARREARAKHAGS